MKILIMIKFDGSFLSTRWGNFPEKPFKTLPKSWERGCKLKLYEQSLKCFENQNLLSCKLGLEEIYQIKANAVNIWHKILRKIVLIRVKFVYW